jgi:fibronectin-binding autotransporter adhesin
MAVILAVGAMAGSAGAAVRTWDKGAGTLDWGAATNWSTDSMPGVNDTAKFAATGIAAGDVIDANGDRSVLQLQFGDGNDLSFPADLILGNGIAGSAITLLGGGAAGETAVQRGTKAAGAVTIAADLRLAPATAGVTAMLIVSQGNSSNGIGITGAIGEAAPGIGLIKDGGKLLLLTSSASSYSGVTTVRQGDLLVGADVPSGGPGALGNAASAVQLGDAVTAGTQSMGLLTTGAFTVARDIVVNSTASTGNVAIGADGAQTGESVFSGMVTLNKSIDAQAGASATVDFQGRITGTGGIAKTGAGTVRLTNAANDYTGATIVRRGDLILDANAPSGAPGALGNTVTPVELGDANTSGSQDLGLMTSGRHTVGRDIIVNATESTGNVVLGGHTSQRAGSTFTGTVTLNRDVRLRSATNNGRAVEFSGMLTGPGGVEKIGSGIVLLSSLAGNDYAGPTTVTAGALLVDAAHSGVGAYTVRASAILGGSGSIVAPVTIEEGGLLTPGSSIGSLYIGNDVNLNGTLAIEFDGTAGTSDLLTVVGALTLGSTAKLDLIDAAIDGDARILATYTTLVGEFDPLNITGLPAGYAVDYAYEGPQIALVASVPEPGLAGLLVGAMLLLRRRSPVSR